VSSTIRQAKNFGLRTIVIDNASTYQATRAFLSVLENEGEARLLRLSENHGHVCWALPEIYSGLPDRFFLTDPDLQWNPDLPKDFPQQLMALCSAHNPGKIGFALDVSDGAKMLQDTDYVEPDSICSWEKQFWDRRIPSESHELYDAAIDTTFQLFNKLNPRGPHIRVAGAFSAKHLPWYRDSDLSPHDLLHMYVTSKASTIAKLVLRNMVSAGTLRGAFEECQATCTVPIDIPVESIESWTCVRGGPKHLPHH
jgi:hypothetical protein